VTERKTRLALLLISLLIASALLYKGRDADQDGVPAAFLHYTSGVNIVRLKGCVPKPGIYRFPNHVTVEAVINMTASSLLEKIADKRVLNTYLEGGEIIEALAKDKQHIEIIIYKMKARERMLLGIPLDPDEMDLADWESLPGIGPKLAKAIMDNRQKYGDIGSFDSLQRVPGVGGGKLKAVKRYFRPPLSD
jgi:competence protein ComEA